RCLRCPPRASRPFHAPAGSALYPLSLHDALPISKAITRDTVVVVGSAPSFPHGVIDPIEELSELARARGIGFHTDACLGGFVLRSEEHTSELQSRENLVCRLLLEKKKKPIDPHAL